MKYIKYIAIAVLFLAGGAVSASVMKAPVDVTNFIATFYSTTRQTTTTLEKYSDPDNGATCYFTQTRFGTPQNGVQESVALSCVR